MLLFSAKKKCVWHSGSKGDHVECPSGKQVFGTCGSLDMSRCHQGDDRYKCINIQCCGKYNIQQYSADSSMRHYNTGVLQKVNEVKSFKNT